MLTTFVLVGTVLSYDSLMATVSFDMNPKQNGGPALAVLPVKAIPCDIAIGKKVYVTKYKEKQLPIITCEKEK